MRRILLGLILFPSLAFAQLTTTQISAQSDTEIRQKLYSPGRADAMFQVFSLWKKGFFPDGVATGTDTYAVAVAGVSVYLTNASFRVQFPTANTVTNPSLNVNTLGVKTIFNNAGSALSVGDIKAGGTYDLIYDGANFRVMNIAGGGGGGGSSLSDLTAATAPNDINNGNFQQTWRWDELAANIGLELFSNSTAAAANNNTVLRVQSSGANAIAGQTTYAARFINDKTGTTGTNIAGYFSASGGVNNTALMASGLTDLRGLGTGTGKVFRIAGSTDIERFKVLDNGETIISNGGGSLTLRNDGINSLVGNSNLSLVQAGAGGVLNLTNSVTTSTAVTSFNFSGKNFNPASGSIDHTFLNLIGTVNQTGTATGVIRGIHIKPVLTSVTGKYVGLEIDAASNFALVANGKSEFNGNITVPSGNVDFKNDNMIFTVGAGGSNYFQIRQLSTARVWMASTTTMGWNADVGFSRVGAGHLALGNATLDSFSGRLSASEIVLGSNSITTNAILDLQSTSKAFIPPRMTTAERNNIATPSQGMEVYDTSTKTKAVHDGTEWIEPLNLDMFSRLENDFIAIISPATTTISGANSSAAIVDFGINTTENALGTLGLATGLTATGRAAMHINTQSVKILNSRVTMKQRAALSALSTGTDTYTSYIGWGENFTSGDMAEGAYFRYTHSVNGGKIEAVTALAGVRTAQDTGVTPSANVFDVFEIIATSTTVTFKINGTSVATITTNIPTGFIFPIAKIEKSVGVSITSLYVDYYDIRYTRQTNR